MTIRDNGTGFKSEAESKRHGLGLVRRLSNRFAEPRWSTRIMARFGPSDFPLLILSLRKRRLIVR